jgi:hypothetical protein
LATVTAHVALPILPPGAVTVATSVCEPLAVVVVFQLKVGLVPE